MIYPSYLFFARPDRIQTSETFPLRVCCRSPPLIVTTSERAGVFFLIFFLFFPFFLSSFFCVPFSCRVRRLPTNEITPPPTFSCPVSEKGQSAPFFASLAFFFFLRFFSACAKLGEFTFFFFTCSLGGTGPRNILVLVLVLVLVFSWSWEVTTVDDLSSLCFVMLACSIGYARKSAVLAICWKGSLPYQTY